MTKRANNGGELGASPALLTLCSAPPESSVAAPNESISMLPQRGRSVRGSGSATSNFGFVVTAGQVFLLPSRRKAAG
jgi:hypothetical protein